MFDPQNYNVIFNACHSWLQNNMRQLGTVYPGEFMFHYDPSNGPAARRNAENLYNWIANQATQLNNGQSSLNDHQLFQLVGEWIAHTYTTWTQGQRQQQQPQSGFGSPASRFGGGNQQMAGNAFSRVSGGFTAAQPVAPGSHLSGASEDMRQQPSPTPMSTQRPPEPKIMTPPPVQATNPLDTLPATGIEFSRVDGKPLWDLNESALDNRIVIANRTEHKTQDKRYHIVEVEAVHQQILNDPLCVVKDFFDIVPSGFLGETFTVKIQYNHLDLIDVPQVDFLSVRALCLQAWNSNVQTTLYKKITTALDSMTTGSYRAITKYLLRHINRALWLSCRLGDSPADRIQIGAFEDLEELLSPTFRHAFTMIPEGRHKLEWIVTNALWNALVRNATALFDNDVLPTHALQSSPAFPFSIPGVYPNKYSIPTPQEASAEDFLNRMRESVLSKATFILSRRAVVITNILGDQILDTLARSPAERLASGSIAYNPIRFDAPSGRMLNGYALPYEKQTSSIGDPVVPFVSEDYPADQLSAFYDNAQEVESALQSKAERTPISPCPLDQTIFAVKYGVSPETYLAALDVFSVLDDKLGRGQVILSKKSVPTLKTTV